MATMPTVATMATRLMISTGAPAGDGGQGAGGTTQTVAKRLNRRPSCLTRTLRFCIVQSPHLSWRPACACLQQQQDCSLVQQQQAGDAASTGLPAQQHVRARGWPLSLTPRRCGGRPLLLPGCCQGWPATRHARGTASLPTVGAPQGPAWWQRSRTVSQPTAQLLLQRGRAGRRPARSAAWPPAGLFIHAGCAPPAAAGGRPRRRAAPPLGGRVAHSVGQHAVGAGISSARNGKWRRRRRQRWPRLALGGRAAAGGCRNAAP
jgi:hypothetical protein